MSKSKHTDIDVKDNDTVNSLVNGKRVLIVSGIWAIVVLGGVYMMISHAFWH